MRTSRIGSCRLLCTRLLLQQRGKGAERRVPPPSQSGLIRRAGPRADRAAAFTMIEVMVVLVLVTLLATMIVPRMAGSSQSAQLRESAQRLLQAARYARGYAVSHRCQCRLLIDTAQNRYALEYQPDPEHRPDQYAPLDRGTRAGRKLGPGVRFEMVRIYHTERRETESKVVTFEPTGQADAATIQVGNQRRTYSLLISPSTGRAHLADERVEEPPADRIDLDA